MQVIVVELSNLSLTSNLTMQTYANITSKIAETIIESYKWLDREKPMEKIAIRKLSIISTLAIEMADECEKLKERFTMQRQIISDVAGEITVARTDKTKQKEEQERLLVINKQRHTLGMAEVESFEELYAEAERNAEMARSDQKNAEEKEFTLAIIQAVSGLVEKAAAAGAGAMAGGPAGAAAALAAAASSKNQNNAGAAPSNVPKPETSAGDNLSLPDQPEAGGGTDPTPSETSVSANPPLPTKPDDISSKFPHD
ncbi:hypothetical protein BC833DRAFT_311125 [Globomyces pollinis-pini]|nr:hypothetical protein BC833DRAFT_311125 [Globomyces pollinis-pini]